MHVLEQMHGHVVACSRGWVWCVGAGMPVPNLTNAGDHFLHCINKDFLVTSPSEQASPCMLTSMCSLCLLMHACFPEIKPSAYSFAHTPQRAADFSECIPCALLPCIGTAQHHKILCLMRCEPSQLCDVMLLSLLRLMLKPMWTS